MKNEKTSPTSQSNNMTKIITNLELDTILTETINAKNHYYNLSKTYFTDLYNLGCRSKEPLSIERWSYNNNKVYLNTFKTEAIRIFEANQLSENLLYSILENKPAYGGLTYDQLTLDFTRSIPVHPIYVGDKIANTYLFRYNRAKQMHDKGNKISDVQNFFGWNSDDVCRRYILTELVYDTDRIYRH